MPTIQLLQFIILALGIGGSMFTAIRVSQRNTGKASWQAALPHLLVLAVFGLINVYLFTLPIVHRV